VAKTWVGGKNRKFPGGYHRTTSNVNSLTWKRAKKGGDIEEKIKARITEKQIIKYALTLEKAEKEKRKDRH